MKKRKNLKIYLISLIIGIVAFNYSCVDDVNFGDSFLEKEPGVDVTIDTVFSKAENARRFLWETYGKLYYALPVYWNEVDDKMNMGMFEALSDCFHSHLNWDGVNRHYYNGSYNAGKETGGDTRFGFAKENTWEAIRSSWLFIENVDRVPDMDAPEKARLTAEAKVIIASRYFDMIRHFGGLPIIDKAFPFSTNAQDYMVERASIEETVNFVTTLLDEAAQKLPWALEADESSNWDGRFTKAAAMGLKCKVLLFAASPLFNADAAYSTESPQIAVEKQQVWYGGYKAELWDKCLAACEDFFKEVERSGRYELFKATGTSLSDYRTAYRNAYSKRGSGWDNPEMLISTRVRYSYGDNYQWDYYFPQSCMNGAFTPTQEFVEMFPFADGTPFDWNNADHQKNMFVNRDPRLYETVLVNNASYQGRLAEMWVGGREIAQGAVTESGQFATGYALYKFILDLSINKNIPTLWPYLRMAEVHLIYAEALLKAGKTPQAIAEVNKVRSRVGLKGLKESMPQKDFNKEAVLLEAILNERAIELGFEDVRLFDLIRHKRAQDFQKELHGILIRRADGQDISWSDKDQSKPRPTEFTYEKFKLTNSSRSWWTKFSSKWYLSAFPVAEVNKDYGLTQNPGW